MKNCNVMSKNLLSNFFGEQTNRRKQLLDKLSKIVLGHNVEKIFQIVSLVRNAEVDLMV
jgi:hypothetical protein